MNSLDIKPVVNKKVYLQIIDTVIGLINDGKLEYGDKLYNEAELMKILNVSRPTLREALRVMEFLGIVTVNPGKGIVINNPENNSEYFPFTYILMFEKTSSASLFELRRAIELEMVGLAAIRGKEEDFANVKNALDEMCNISLDDIENFTKLDLAFHANILICAKNDLCFKLMHTLSKLIYEQLLKVNAKTSYEVKKNTIEAHTQIYNALVKRDIELSKTLMQKHLAHSYAIYVESL